MPFCSIYFKISQHLLNPYILVFPPISLHQIGKVYVRTKINNVVILGAVFYLLNLKTPLTNPRIVLNANVQADQQNPIRKFNEQPY